MRSGSAAFARRTLPGGWLAAGIGMAAAACAGEDALGTREERWMPDVPGLSISEPMLSPGVVTEADVVWVSMQGGMAPTGFHVQARSSSGDTAAGPVIHGGFDPIAVQSEVGDTVSVTVTDVYGQVVAAWVAQVKARKPPVIVRTEPLPRKRDVPLNASLLVVFSEPVDPVTVTDQTIRLFRGIAQVPGEVRLEPDGLRAEFQPLLPLEPATQYLLEVTTGVTDLAGEPLTAPGQVPFVTAPIVTPDTTAADTTAPAGRLVFASLTDRQIYSVGADGAGRSQLTAYNWNTRPAWSPDGGRIAFVGYDEASVPDIYLMNADGSQVTRRTTGSGYASAAWSPDGRKLAVSTEGLYYSDIWVISADDDGSPPTHLATAARSPAWSPDGRRIAFVQISGDDGYDALAVMNSDGSGLRSLTPQAGGRYGPAWSADGQWLASSVCEAGTCDLFIMDAEGANVKRLTDVGNVSWGGSWSPDGRFIAVSLWDYARGAVSLAVVPADGGAPRWITDDGYAPSWRPQ